MQDKTSYTRLLDLLKANRSVRIFKEDHPISPTTLRDLVVLTRYTASGRNAQPLKYRLVYEKQEREEVFPLLAWAGYFKDWDGPEPGQRPAAYLIQCLDTTFGNNCLCDDGLQLEAITLGATTMGLGCCIIKAFNAPKLSEVLCLPEHLIPRYVLAVGYPGQKVVIEKMKPDPDDPEAPVDFKYYRTPDGVHHVPKRPVSELIIPAPDTAV
ncbi:MAG: nitroreductase family protein [Muribaculaceae bacterium]|nr:nitroreductase family protein [Muribaculaceae bacterium]